MSALRPSAMPLSDREDVISASVRMMPDVSDGPTARTDLALQKASQKAQWPTWRGAGGFEESS